MFNINILKKVPKSKLYVIMKTLKILLVTMILFVAIPNLWHWTITIFFYWSDFRAYMEKLFPLTMPLDQYYYTYCFSEIFRDLFGVCFAVSLIKSLKCIKKNNILWTFIYAAICILNAFIYNWACPSDKMAFPHVLLIGCAINALIEMQRIKYGGRSHLEG